MPIADALSATARHRVKLSIKVCVKCVDILDAQSTKDTAVKIDDSIKKAAGLPVGTAQARAGKGADKASQAGSLGATQSDSVHLSSQAQALAGKPGGGVFDAARVEEIKAAIADGTFKVDPEKVANGLLDTVTDLLRNRKS